MAVTTIKTEQAIKNITLVRVVRGSNQTLGTGAAAKVQLNSEIFDVGGNFDNATNYRFVAPVNGYYLVSGGIEISQMPDAKRIIVYIYKGGAEYARCQAHASYAQDIGAQITQIVQLNATEYVELYAFQDSGSDKNITTATNMNVQLITIT